MTEDGWLIALSAVVWGALAVLYAFVPMFDMPGSALIWGSGAVVFVGLAALIARAERRNA
jgi:hypothetical protein